MLDVETQCYVSGYNIIHLISGTYELSCQQNPLVINVSHHLNVLSHRTSSLLLNFSSPLVGISAVALRTPSHISSSTLNDCILEHEGQNHQGQRYRVPFLPFFFSCGCEILLSSPYVPFCFQWVFNHELRSGSKNY